MVLPAAYSDGPRPQDRIRQPPVPSEQHAEEQDLWTYFDVLWERKFLLAGVTLVAAVLATAVSVMQPRRYTAEAAIFLTPPTYATTLRPGVMSVEAYARLAETEHMLALVNAELKTRHQDLFKAEQERERELRVGYAARLSASREPQKPYLPLIGLTATAITPEKAQAAANTWADVFISEESKISAVGKSNSANFILREYPKLEKALVENESALRILLAKQAQELAALKADVGITLRTAQLESYEWMVVQQGDALAAARTRLDRLRPSVAALEKELAATPQHLVTSKAMTDDAVWRAQSQNQPAGSEAVSGARLQSQEVNPVYVTLSQRLGEDRVNLNALEPQIRSLQQQLEASRKRTTEVLRGLLDGEMKIADMERRHAVEAGGLDRAVVTSRRSFETLSEKIGEARLAQSEPDQDLKLGAYAGLPSTPSGPRRSLLVLGATLAAFGLTALSVLAIGLFKGHRRDLQAGSRERTAARL